MSDLSGDEDAGVSEKAEGPSKLGHRKVNKVTGEVAFKKVSSNALMEAIQMGVRDSIGRIDEKKKKHRDLLHTGWF